jgi:hypothetical protein
MIRKCTECSKRFDAGSTKRITCSPEHKRDRERKAAKVWADANRRKPTKDCVVCGKISVAPFRTFCCQAHKDEHRKRASEKRNDAYVLKKFGRARQRRVWVRPPSYVKWTPERQRQWKRDYERERRKRPDVHERHLALAAASYRRRKQRAMQDSEARRAWLEKRKKWKREWFKNNPEKTKAKHAKALEWFKRRYASDPEFRAKHQKIARERAKERRLRDPETVRMVKRKYTAANRGKILEQGRRWRKAHPESSAKAVERARIWKEKNPERVRQRYYEGPPNPKGERQWLQRSRAQLRNLKRLLSKGIIRDTSKEPSPRVSPSPKRASTPRSNLQG